MPKLANASQIDKSKILYQEFGKDPMEFAYQCLVNECWLIPVDFSYLAGNYLAYSLEEVYNMHKSQSHPEYIIGKKAWEFLIEKNGYAIVTGEVEKSSGSGEQLNLFNRY